MSLFSWLFPLRRGQQPPQLESSGLSRMDPTHPLSSGDRPNLGGNAQPANKKQERMVRRELLYGVVREAMARAGVRSSNYKFKVLSLDSRGRQFLIMVDLSRDCGIDVPHLAEIEAMVGQAAKQRHEIVVTSVYWRMNEHVAVGDPKSKPVPAKTAVALPEAQLPTAAAESARPARFDPIGADEVEAFKRALASGLDNSAAAAQAAGAQGAAAVGFDGVARHGPQSYTLLTGYEDTEVDEEERPEELSGTQYGQLN